MGYDYVELAGGRYGLTGVEMKKTERLKTLRFYFTSKFYKMICACLSGSQVIRIPNDLKVRSSA